MKKNFFALLVFAAFNFNPLFSNPASQINEYILENGMEVFLLEDSSDALVHVELSVKAGFSSQTQQTNGFFKLYTNLVKAMYSNLDQAECNSDWSSYKITATSGQLEEVLQRLSECAFSLQFSDEMLASGLSAIKTESEENAASMSGFINSAIDSKVFSAAPWQHDSGIYPQIFKKTTPKNARTILNAIAQKWYIPKNSALFISGNFNSEKTLNLIKNSFGRFYSSYPLPSSKPALPINLKKRFVLHNPEFSPELTQIVIQYTKMNREEAELTAAALNIPGSRLKNRLLEDANLNIPGDEYIHVAAAHKKDTSRVIIQSLLQKPEDKKSKITSCQQVLSFLDKVLQTPLQNDELNLAKQQLFYDFETISSNPQAFMQNLCTFWNVRQYQKSDYSRLTIIEEFQNQPESLSKISCTELQKLLAAEEPFVFVIINSEDYKKQKAQYKAAGFEEITIDKASWYLQEMYREIRNQLKPDEESYFTASKDSPDNDYFERNVVQIENSRLDNGIPLTVKKNTNTSDVSLLISIKGGELNSSANHGFEEVMINIMAGMIQKEVLSQQINHVILGNVTITPQTKLAASSILVSCIPQDFNAVCAACAKSLIYREIPPALADRAVSSRQYKKRLENGSAVRQLYSNAILAIFGKSAMSAVTNTEGDVLQTTDYKSILQAYPAFLDGSKFSLILTGDFEEDAVAQVKKEFGLLAVKKKAFTVKKCSPKSFDNKTLSVKIVHTFLTDVPAEKAGPMPAVLIPTTEFLDPLIYAYRAPEAGTKEAALFNALLNYLEGEIQHEIDSVIKDSRQKVEVRLPCYSLDYGFIIIQNAAHLRDSENAIKRALQNLSAKLTSPVAGNTVIPQIKNEWTKKQMAETASNRGTAQLIQKGTELFPDNPRPEFYLTEYKQIQDAGPQDYIEAFKYFPSLPQLKVLSKDSKN